MPALFIPGSGQVVASAEWPGLTHPRPLTDRCMTASRDTARAIVKRAAAFRLKQRAPPVSRNAAPEGGLSPIPPNRFEGPPSSVT